MNMLSALIILMAAIGGPAAGPDRNIAAGRMLYDSGEYRKAAAQFEAALKIRTTDPAIWYWAGMSYEKLADIAVPLDRKYRSRARRALSRAAELAPTDAEYRRELFHFLLEPGGSLRQAAAILQALDESDPEFPLMNGNWSGRAARTPRRRRGWAECSLPLLKRCGPYIGSRNCRFVESRHGDRASTKNGNHDRIA